MVYQYHETLLLACHYRLTQEQKKDENFSVKAAQLSIIPSLFRED